MAVANEKVVGALGWDDLLMAKPVDEREGRQSVGDLSFMEPRQAHGGRKVDQHSGGSSDLVAPELKRSRAQFWEFGERPSHFMS